ncbi:19579_t:CDS:1, partial [Gigaspora margarita]
MIIVLANKITNEYEMFALPNDSQCNSINEKKEDCKIYVQDVSS